VAHSTALRLADRQCFDIAVIVSDLEATEFAVTTPGEECGVDEIAEATVSAVEQARDLVGREITDDRCIDRSERLHAAPGVV
jgi:hypothetical protein